MDWSVDRFGRPVTSPALSDCRRPPTSDPSLDKAWNVNVKCHRAASEYGRISPCMKFAHSTKAAMTLLSISRCRVSSKVWPKVSWLTCKPSSAVDSCAIAWSNASSLASHFVEATASSTLLAFSTVSLTARGLRRIPTIGVGPPGLPRSHDHGTCCNTSDGSLEVHQGQLWRVGNKQGADLHKARAKTAEDVEKFQRYFMVKFTATVAHPYTIILNWPPYPYARYSKLTHPPNSAEAC